MQDFTNLSTTSFRSASAIPSTTDAPPTVQGNPCQCVWLRHLDIRASSMPKKERKKATKEKEGKDVFLCRIGFTMEWDRNADRWWFGELTWDRLTSHSLSKNYVGSAQCQLCMLCLSTPEHGRLSWSLTSHPDMPTCRHADNPTWPTERPNNIRNDRTIHIASAKSRRSIKYPSNIQALYIPGVTAPRKMVLLLSLTGSLTKTLMCIGYCTSLDLVSKSAPP